MSAENHWDETNYEKGWTDGYNGRHANPFALDSWAGLDYEEGYNDAVAGHINAKKFLGKDFIEPK